MEVDANAPIDVALLLGNAGEQLHLHVVGRPALALPWATGITLREGVVLDADADQTGRAVLSLTSMTLLAPGSGDVWTEEVPDGPGGGANRPGPARVEVRGDGPSDRARLVLPSDLLGGEDQETAGVRARFLIDTHLMGRADFIVDLVVAAGGNGA